MRRSYRIGAALTALVLLALPTAAVACAPPDPIRDLDLPRYYRDAAKSVVDPAKLAENKAATKALRDYVRAVVAAADQAQLDPSEAQRVAGAGCALRHLDRWASGEALLGKMKTRQAEYERKWTVAALALAYLKVRTRAPRDLDSRIADWLGALSDRAYRNAAKPGRARNNHWYWVGLGEAAVALIDGNETRWSRAGAIFDDAMAETNEQGLLPQEVARARRGLVYHEFALMPLVAMVVLADAKGEDWRTRSDDRLRSLTLRTARGLRKPETFPSGWKQDASGPRGGWAGLATHVFRRDREVIRAVRRLKAKPAHRLLGGDASALLKALRLAGADG
ncbi:MAG: alginate lyase family protein [Pseudomonadota bacterium]